jgi:hypothetical protein
MWFFFLLTGFIDLYECADKDGFFAYISQCKRMVDPQSINQESQTTKLCSYVSGCLHTPLGVIVDK